MRSAQLKRSVRRLRHPNVEMKEPNPLVEESGEPRVVDAGRFSDSTKAAACLLFLAVSVGLWLSIDSSWARVVYYLLFLIPNYACGEWLGSRIFF